MSYYNDWAPYVPVAQRKANGVREATKRMKKGDSLQPVKIVGNQIAKTFWGRAWCSHFESYRDYANRLPRGKTYARNGSVCDLRVMPGKVTGMVCGSELYDVVIRIEPLKAKQWAAIRKSCGESVHSLIDLMRGHLSDEVIGRLTDPKTGMFPIGTQMRMSCDCPDSSRLCKHIAAVMYGVANRLDASPELLFVLRAVDQNELITDAIASPGAGDAMGLDQESSLAGEDLGAIFGIEMAEEPVKKKPVKKKPVKKKAVKRKAVKKKVVKKKAVKKKAARKKAAKKKSRPRKS